MQLNTESVASPVRPAATVVVLRDAAPGLEVLLLKRHGLSDVLGGAHVFPGGKVDASDAAASWHTLLDRAPAQLHAALHEPELSPADATALYVAAVREAFEESGILFAPGATRQQAVAARELLRGGLAFGAVLERLGLGLHTDAVLPWSRWITPQVPLVSNKRFDTRFFLAALPPDQEAVHDNHEATESVWCTPLEGLQRYRQGEIALAPPQIMSLSTLTHFKDVQAALRQARRSRPPVVAPEPFQLDGQRAVCYPGDERHSIAERAFPGPTRLTYRNGRFEPADGFEALFAAAPGFFAPD